MPARIMLIGVGASTWASGSQVWNGNTGTLMAKPMKRNQRTVEFAPGLVVCRLRLFQVGLGRLQLAVGLLFALAGCLLAFGALVLLGGLDVGGGSLDLFLAFGDRSLGVVEGCPGLVRPVLRLV